VKYFSQERRSKPRIYIPFPAKVSGVNVEGEGFTVSSVIDNLSSEGLYIRIMPCVKPKSRLSIIVSLATAAAPDEIPPRISVNGTVLRVDEKPGGAWGIAVKFKQGRFNGYVPA
jgi:hypothetical protein